jgi:molybdopterin converting factor subunit 1
VEGLGVSGRLDLLNHGLGSMTRVRIEYFAILREHVGKSAEEVQTEAGTAGELFDELAARYAFPEMNQMKVAINDEFGEWDSILTEGDAIVFIPPVAGG